MEVNGEVFKVYTVDRVQQRFWSRSPSLIGGGLRDIQPVQGSAASSQSTLLLLEFHIFST